MFYLRRLSGCERTGAAIYVAYPTENKLTASRAASYCQPVDDPRILVTMPIKFERLTKSLSKLRKTLKRWPSDPSVEEVHHLRTQTRRLEAMLDAFMIEEQPEMRRLLKAVTPIRKAAGAVRDMDVLVADALILRNGAKDECIIRLVEHLGSVRFKSARNLDKVIHGRRKQGCRRLKQCARLLHSKFTRKKLASVRASPARAVGVATALVDELRGWPRLNEGNLHEFRKEVKKLRYILQLGASQGSPAEKSWVDALGKAKDEIGEWHDWTELLQMAHNVLGRKHHGPMLMQIEKTASNRFKRALVTADTLRERYLSRRRNSELNDTVVKTVARLLG
jgi:CHAD domain-containing protein